MRMIYNDLWNDGTVTPSSAQPGYAGANTQNRFTIKAWRTTADADENIVLDYGSAVSADGVAIIGHNLTASATINLQGNATDSWGAPSIDETLTSRSGVILHWFTSGSYRYWRVRIQDPTNPDTYLQVGRIILGPRFSITEAGRSAVAEFPESRVRGDRVSFALSNEPYADIGPAHREYSYQFRNIGNTLKTAFDTMVAAVGRHTPVVFTHFDDDTDSNWDVIAPLYGLINADIQPDSLGSKRWTLGLSVREVA